MLRRWLKTPSLCLLFSGAVLTAPALAQSQCKDVEQAPVMQCNDAQLTCGTQKYDLGFFSDAVEWLKPCLPHAFKTIDQREWAHRIVALAYYELGDEVEAESWIQSLMKMNRNYRADSGEPQFFRERVIALKPKAWHQKTWVRLGGGAVIGGAILYFLFRPAETPPPLPLAPGFPGSGG